MAILTNPLLISIANMHKKFGIRACDVPFSAEEKEFRIVAMREEIQEYEDSGSLVDQLDALVDLMVFALGTVERMGYLAVFEEAFMRVQQANLQKEVGQNQKRGNFQLDLVKPEGWKPPQLHDLIVKAAGQDLTSGYEPDSDLLGYPDNVTFDSKLEESYLEPDAMEATIEAEESLNQVKAELEADLERSGIIKSNPSRIDKTLSERGSRYGEFEDNANIVQEMMKVLESAPNYKLLTNQHREAYHMVIHKMARSVCGDPMYVDNVHDIVGYSKLLEDFLVKEENKNA